MAPQQVKKLWFKLRAPKQSASPDFVSSPSTQQLSQSRSRQSESRPKINGNGPTETTTSLPTLQGRIWDKAYDELKESESKIVEAYEKILSTRLRGRGMASVSSEHVENEIEKEPGARCQQMQQLIQTGLDRRQKEASIKQDVNQGLEVVQTLRKLVDKAMQSAPQAAIPWACVCIGLEILSNPMTEPSANRQGITHVLSRMDWYWNLVDLLLDENKARETATGRLRDQLEKHIIQLYGKLLLYQMKSVCLYHRNWATVIGRDLLKLDGWGAQLTDIKEAEDAVKNDSEQYNSQNILTALQELATTAVSQEKQLGCIHGAIWDQTRQQEMRHQNDSNKKCLRDLLVTDPREDKERIEDTKGGLLWDSYQWIFNHDDFCHFRVDTESRLFWIRGDPGKGKTMLLCGIIKQLEKEGNSLLSFFFCQATEAQLSSATSVLRGLIYLLLIQQPSLISHLQAKYDETGKKLFQGPNVWGALVKIFKNMLKDPVSENAILVVDALDECVTDRPKLLDLMVQSTGICRAKWIISSRNWPDIEQKLQNSKEKIRLHLELNQKSVSEAVGSYIKYKVNQLAVDKEYDDETRSAVEVHLTSNANGTFLWVALVCQELADPDVQSWHTREKLTSFPPGLQSLYRRMMDKLQGSIDAMLCNEILATASVVYRPITLEELRAITASFKSFTLRNLEKLISCCGSFLTLREGVIYFVHQSAKEYLTREASSQILPNGLQSHHHAIFSRSLEVLSDTLIRANIYKLTSPGCRIDQVSAPSPDPLAPARYPCIYWVDHLCDSESAGADPKRDVEDCELIYGFIQQKYLYWLESLSLLRCVSEGVTALQKLRDIARRKNLQLLDELLQDARRFILSHKSASEVAPLQLYASALLFSPAHSQVRILFKKDEPDWVALKSIARTNWGKCLQTLEGHSGGVNSVAFSYDSRLVASASYDKTIRIWRADTGECTQTLEGHSRPVSSVAFSHDSQLVASASGDETVRIWRADTGECTQTLEGHSRPVSSVAFSHDSQLVASASGDGTVRIWRADTGECTQTINVGRFASVLSFEADRILTSIGALTILGMPSKDAPEPVTGVPANRIGYGISLDNRWVTLNGENTFWLPMEFRPICSAVSETTVAIGCSSGKVIVLEFSCRGI